MNRINVTSKRLPRIDQAEFGSAIGATPLLSPKLTINKTLGGDDRVFVAFGGKAEGHIDTTQDGFLIRTFVAKDGRVVGVRVQGKIG